jgi:hypothetical protein
VEVSSNENWAKNEHYCEGGRFKGELASFSMIDRFGQKTSDKNHGRHAESREAFWLVSAPLHIAKAIWAIWAICYEILSVLCEILARR